MRAALLRRFPPRDLLTLSLLAAAVLCLVNGLGTTVRGAAASAFLPTGLLAGLWGLPGGVLLVGETMEDGIRRTIRGQIGVEVAPTALLTRIKHAYTHFRITLFAWRCQHTAGVPQPLQCAEVRWVLPDALPGLAFPATDARILQALKAAASA